MRALKGIKFLFLFLTGVIPFVASATCTGTLCSSPQNLVEFAPNPKKPNNISKVVGLGLTSDSDEILSSGFLTCLNAPLPPLDCGEKTCPSGCCDSGAVRSCKTVIVRGQEKAVEQSGGRVADIDARLPGLFKGNQKKGIGTGSLTFEAAPTSYPCTTPGAKSCPAREALLAKGCSAMKSDFEARKASWMKAFGEAAKEDPDFKDWNDNSARCKKGEGKYTVGITDAVCGEDGSFKSWPTSSFRADCVEGAYGFALTVRLQAVRSCDTCSIEGKTSKH